MDVSRSGSSFEWLAQDRPLYQVDDVCIRHCHQSGVSSLLVPELKWSERSVSDMSSYLDLNCRAAQASCSDNGIARRWYGTYVTPVCVSLLGEKVVRMFSSHTD